MEVFWQTGTQSGCRAENFFWLLIEAWPGGGVAGRPVRRLHKGWGLGLDQGNGWEVPQGRPPESPGGDLAVQRKQQQTSTEASGVEPLVPTGHASPSTSSEFLGLSRGLQTPPAASSC